MVPSKPDTVRVLPVVVLGTQCTQLELLSAVHSPLVSVIPHSIGGGVSLNFVVQMDLHRRNSERSSIQVPSVYPAVIDKDMTSPAIAFHFLPCTTAVGASGVSTARLACTWKAGSSRSPERCSVMALECFVRLPLAPREQSSLSSGLVSPSVRLPRVRTFPPGTLCRSQTALGP